MFRLILILVVLFHPAITLAQDYVIWNGGITIDERNEAPTNGTKLVFFVTGGNFLSDVDVSIVDSNDRELVNTTTEGPWLIVRLPAGSYTLEATRGNGDKQSIAMQVEENDNSEFGIMFPGS